MSVKVFVFFASAVTNPVVIVLVTTLRIDSSPPDLNLLYSAFKLIFCSGFSLEQKPAAFLAPVFAVIFSIRPPGLRPLYTIIKIEGRRC